MNFFLDTFVLFASTILQFLPVEIPQMKFHVSFLLHHVLHGVISSVTSQSDIATEICVILELLLCQDLQKSVYDTHKEAVRSKSHASERDEAVAQLTKELERKSHRLKKEKEMRQSVKEEACSGRCFLVLSITSFVLCS